MRPHRFDPISLVAGLLFAFLAVFFLVGDHTTNDLGWPWAVVIPLVAMGFGIVLAGLRRILADRPDADAAVTSGEADEPVEPPA